MSLLLADCTHAVAQMQASPRSIRRAIRTSHHFSLTTGLPKMTALGLRSRYPVNSRTERAAAETSCKVRVSSYITGESLKARVRVLQNLAGMIDHRPRLRVGLAEIRRELETLLSSPMARCDTLPAAWPSRPATLVQGSDREFQVRRAD